MSGLSLHRGAGSFVFVDDCPGRSRSLRVFYFLPGSLLRDARVVMAMHGLDRAAAEFRDALAGQAERKGQILLVPEFDAKQFPDAHAYNYGGVRSAPPNGTVLPREVWNFGIIDRLFQHVRLSVGSLRRTFGLFGNSAGSQYVLRYLALTEGNAVDSTVASNSGMYMLPDLRIEYPVGMGGLDLDESHLRRYLGRRLTVLLGADDVDSAAPDLPRGATALAQGPHRLARGLWHFEHCSKLAQGLGVRLVGRSKSFREQDTSARKSSTEQPIFLRSERPLFLRPSTMRGAHLGSLRSTGQWPAPSDPLVLYPISIT